ncbi:YqgE/AlgH family protein [uncultured Chitinophaga sp.]|uniref:YqgE/AlgH family protein n=1 Tax=uncultured Chitinophaga sp. TaxID=339340 RepID=UPI0025F12DDB|nr:YqgE/AlgH family protein [uncultured Chitinophaga sp.]
MVQLSPGILLIADPFLKDPNFARAVILLCEHQDRGSFGFVINKLFDQRLDELIPDIIPSNIPVFNGGPVQQDTIHFVHQVPELIEGGFEIVPGLYWGGRFDAAVELINAGKMDLSKIKFFIGYSGWSTGQLEAEFKDKSWILSHISVPLVFKEKDQDVWKLALKNLGHSFAMMANFPIDPSLN